MPETNESTLQAGLPNPLRLPLLFVVGVLAAWGCLWWWGGTGGLDVSRFPRGDPSHSSLLSPVPFFRLLLALPMAVLLVAGILVAWVRAGTASAVAGFWFVLGSQRPGIMPGAALSLSVAARVVTWGGVLVGFAACGITELATPLVNLPSSLDGFDPYHLWWDILHEATRWSLTAPLAGIVLGRFVLGTLAEGARIRTDESCASAFSPLQDLVLLGLFAIPWYQLMLDTWSPYL